MQPTAQLLGTYSMASLLTHRVCCVWALLFCASVTVLGQDARSKYAALLRKERARKAEIMAWGIKKSIPLKERARRLNAPSVAGARRDAVTYRKLAAQTQQRSTQEKAKGQTAEARKFWMLSQGFASLATHHEAAVKALEKGSKRELNQAAVEIKKLEFQYRKLTGNRVARSWFLPGELEMLAGETPPKVVKATGPRQ